MTAVDELIAFLRRCLDAEEQVALRLDARYRVRNPDRADEGEPYWPLPSVEARFRDADPDIAAGLDLIKIYNPQRVLAEVEAKRRVLDEHAAEWRTVEWPHDQDGKGNAQVCRRCQNAEHTEWHPPVGHAGVLPDGFVTPYVLAPCPTVRLLAQPYAGRDGWREEWRA